MSLFNKKNPVFPLALIALSLAYLYTFQLGFLRTHFSHQQTIRHPEQITGEYDPTDTQAIWWGQSAVSYKVPETSANLADARVLGDTSNKHIEVDLTNQRLYAFEGTNKVFDFPISSGLYDWTPRGIFHTWIKIKYAKMEGGSKALHTYYNLPNVPFIQYFGNDQIPNWKGFSIHGAYWHNDFGRPKSHGCINLKPEDAEKLFYWTPPPMGDKSTVKITPDNPGIQIQIYGKYQG